jgi:hypothetical protein
MKKMVKSGTRYRKLFGIDNLRERTWITYRSRRKNHEGVGTQRRRGRERRPAGLYPTPMQASQIVLPKFIRYDTSPVLTPIMNKTVKMMMSHKTVFDMAVLLQSLGVH